MWKPRGSRKMLPPRVDESPLCGFGFWFVCCSDRRSEAGLADLRLFSQIIVPDTFVGHDEDVTLTLSSLVQ